MKKLLIFLFVITSCKSNDQTKNSIEGIWKSIGYGKILKIDSTTYKYFDITNISCLPSKRGEISEIKNSLELINDTLSIKRGFNVYQYTRTEEFLKLCQQSKTNVNKPLYNFEVFAETYKNHYAFFELNKINWDSIYKTAKGKINSKTTEVELYLIIQEMIDSLKDNHGSIEPTDEVYELSEEQNSTEEKTEL